MKESYLKVSSVIAEYPFSKYAVYELIKTDPSFPVIQMGPKKNYRIPSIRFNEWLKMRLKQRDYSKMNIPTPQDLLKA